MSLKLDKAGEFDSLSASYLFSEVRQRKSKFLGKNGGEVIDMGVGDIAYPVCETVVEALVRASLEMGDNARFRGYPPESGYQFLKDAIARFYVEMGALIDAEEVFVGEGAKSDASSFCDLFGPAETIIPEPVYPVYRDSALMRGNSITYLSGNKENDFLPLPHGLAKTPAIIWLCSPNNPTGSVYGLGGLQAWVDYALDSGSVILFDAAYSAFAPEGYPKTIYEAKGAESCAVEFCSLSKSAGFTGLRCSWVTIPRGIKLGGARLIDLWRRRQSAKFNGVSYIIQRGAEAALSKKGAEECAEIVNIYKKNSRILGGFLKKVTYVGSGDGSPYIWFECPKGFTSWEFFDRLLGEVRLVGTPGCGFGPSGEGFFRLSCFATEERAREALGRLEKLSLWN